jgi:hypothetical protein
MVRWTMSIDRKIGRKRSIALFAAVVAVSGPGCRKDADMPERVEMPDSTPVSRAMHDAAMRDSMLDSIPGGEMARGDSAAAMQLLKKKM